ncbi:sigma-70 family RNA polymerase sigma factor [Caldibacillus lycopersici]|uniref:Sigma-70 family RNA polymerase sigma factor n=1 Tax=Perspicuibacillus lycopersici TaxID=1325689 RepID=A0AAE3IU44_9BACI|nr:sigma-70 family RNA polymerase sigma factor [Perspicuibacillus lycopersici]MCU9614648.1 sigma-70 family RNA polymerase sigma factor [Perspicuibacillus lycopersici]
MIPATDSVSIAAIKERSVESIIDWFEYNKQSFYRLSCTYFRNQKQVEELFYQSIMKVRQELPRFKNETSFETWVTSIFIDICRRLSKDNSFQALEESPSDEIFRALDQLNVNEKEAIALAYIKGATQEETAQLLGVSFERLRELLNDGFQSLRKPMGYFATFNGCQEYQNDYLAYLEKNIEHSKKVDLEIHVYHCPHCQEELVTFQEIQSKLTKLRNDLQIPSSVMASVKDRLDEKKKQKQQKIRKLIKRVSFVVGVFVCIFGIGFLTGVIPNLYYAMTEDDQELRTIFQKNYGDRLNLESEYDGIKITIKSVVADDIETVVYYEIEDTTAENQYVMNYGDGVYIENEFEIMDTESYIGYYPPDLESEMNKKEKNVYHGKLILNSLKEDEATLKVNISTIRKLLSDSTYPTGYVDDSNIKYGDWNFEIPVTKQSSKEYVLDKELEVEGVPFRIDKLIMAPSATILQYSINYDTQDFQIYNVDFDNLQVNDKKLKPDLYSGYYYDAPQQMNWNTYQIKFPSMLGEKPKNVKVQFSAIYLSVFDKKQIELDISEEYPKTFEYAGSTISIDKMELEGNTTKIVISNQEIKDRKFESLYFNLLDKDGNFLNYMNISSETVIVDRNGKQYDMYQMDPNMEIEQPRYFDTVSEIDLESANIGENVVSAILAIDGYNTTKYTDKVVEITIE